MKKKVLMLVLVFAFIVSMVPLFGQPYQHGQKIKWYTSIADNAYRTLTVEHAYDKPVNSYTRVDEDAYGEIVRNTYWDNVGDTNTINVRTVTLFENFVFGNTHFTGNPNIVEILSLKNGSSIIPPGYKKGQKITIETLKKEEVWDSITDFRIRTPSSGYYIEFSSWETANWATGQQNRRFGVILSGSEITFQKVEGKYFIMFLHPGSSIGWDKDFFAASNTQDTMKYLSYIADYAEQKKDVDARLNKKGGNKEEAKKDLINAVRKREVIYGTLTGALPPLIGYPASVDFVMKNSYRVPLVCSLGILYDRYKDKNTFDKLFLYDLYALFAGKDKSGNFLFSASVDVGTEVLLKMAEIITTEYGLKTAAKAIPIVGTLWGMGKGAWDSNSEIQKFANDANDYYAKPSNKEFGFIGDTLTFYNGTEENVKVPEQVSPGKPLMAIGKGAFQNNKKIKSVTLPRTITTIGASAFEDCASLTTVTIPSNTSLTSKNIGANAFKGTSLSDASKTALRKFGYTGEGVGKGVTGVTFQNNTKTTVQIIQRKSGSTWTTITAGSLKNGGKIEGVNLADGTYDLRLSTAEAFPKTVAFERKNVKVTDGTVVTFSENDKYKITRADYQEFIQRRCNFSNVNDVWKAMNTHPNADDLYRMWAESYPKDGYFPYPRPSGKTDQDNNHRAVQVQ